jgi:hypothetical protein
VSVTLITLLFRFLRGLIRRLRGHFAPTPLGGA